ncbi:MAG: DUF4837 family protein [FCB group bacterium]|nr:DUF4837 family protein [FCB group bacterium]
MQKRLIIILLPLILACGYLPETTGELNVVHIFCSIQDKPYAEATLDSLFSDRIITPKPEKIFKLKWHRPVEFENFKKGPGLLVISIKRPEDSTGDKLFERFRKSTKKAAPVFSINNIYAKNQSFIAIQGEDAIDFEIKVSQNREWILKEMSNALDKRILSYVRSKGLNKPLMQQVRREFGINMTIQKDFMVIESDSSRQFLWLGRGFPYRWLIYHIQPADKFLNPEVSKVVLKQILDDTVSGITVEDIYQSATVEHRDGRTIRVIRGLYFHPESNSGGPFFTFVVNIPESTNVLLISGFVNFPGYEKMLLLRQLEVMALTYQFDRDSGERR